MSQANLHPMLNIAIKAARAAGAIINRASMDVDRLTVTSKGHNDFVTEVDAAAEEIIIETLLQAYPGHAILGEETGRSRGAKNSDFVWIIDPLDGTTNFIHGFPQYAVSIALAFKGKVEQAVVYDPSRNDLFYATKGRGAFLNDKRLRVSKRVRLADSLIGTGFPFRKGDNFKRYMKMFEEITQACAGVRRPGAAALDLCYVAAGWYDGFFETGLQPWDCAAGSLMITEAGGLVGNFTGEADYLFQRELVCGSPKVYAQLVQILSPYTRMISEDEGSDAAAVQPIEIPAKPARTATRLKAKSTQPEAGSAISVAAASSEPTATDIFASSPQDGDGDQAFPSAGRATSSVAEQHYALTPAQALAAAFSPEQDEEAPAPVVTRKPATRIRKADLPPAEEQPAPRRKPRDDAPF
jgi:myo-inositol-1(or 4)-monophosphatase